MLNIWPIFLALAMQLPAHTIKPANTVLNQILALERSWNQALRQKDGAALTLLLAPELVYVDGDGKVMNKAEYVLSVRSAERRPDHVVDESVSVAVFDTVAVATGIYHESGAKNGKPYSLRQRYIDTWIRRDSAWLCVASQATEISR